MAHALIMYGIVLFLHVKDVYYASLIIDGDLLTIAIFCTSIE